MLRVFFVRFLIRYPTIKVTWGSGVHLTGSLVEIRFGR
jgi:hypothetical protein